MEEDIGILGPFLSLSFCFLAVTRWGTSSAHIPCHDVLPCYRPKGNWTKSPMTETLNQNKSFFFLSLLSQIFCYNNRKLTNPTVLPHVLEIVFGFAFFSCVGYPILGNFLLCHFSSAHHQWTCIELM
jgi:hypothetical protein